MSFQSHDQFVIIVLHMKFTVTMIVGIDEDFTGLRGKKFDCINSNIALFA